uniref:Uncharacterized protein n=1 Tax=Rhizophora mucronata TaxID=61149 RepID=A0A2P2IHK0_RHIMU
MSFISTSPPMPGDSTVNGAAFTGSARRHLADAFFGSATSLFLRFLRHYSSVE